ncbi:MAG: hypothetical protein K0Q97_1003 [Bacillota bacterium]|nr:hypothetical protein [Bacillota bacterium]
MNNKNSYRVMKFLEPLNKKDKSKGYVRLDIRGIKGTIMVSVENLGDSKSYSEVYLYKDKNDKIKLGDINNKKGMIKKIITFGSNDAIEDYNICGVVKENKIVLYANLYNAVNSNDIKKLEFEEENEVEPVDLVDLSVNVEKAEQIDEEEKYEDTYKSNYNNSFIGKDNYVNNGYMDNKYEDHYENKYEENHENKYENEVNINDEVRNTAYNRNDRIFGEEKQVEAEYSKPKYRNKFEENLFEVLKNYEKVKPLSVEINNLTWWKIPFDDRGIKNGFLPYYNQIISSYYPYPMTNRVTTCNGLMKKYGHYIFGVFEEKGKLTKFVYGVPGDFKREEQPYKGLSGFKNWSYKNKKLDGNYGYWLAFIDSTTGEVTEPPQIEVIK